jgi:uncharacterized protein YndB with AHSA1/START domain
MPTARRQRTLSAPPERVWELIADPHHLPRWWPGVRRVEGVTEERFTQVHMTKRGRPVRVDFHVAASEPPRLRSWEQEIAGTPFERHLAESVVEITIDPEGDGSLVAIEHRQRLRGSTRTGGFLLRRATRRRLDEALEGLAAIV